MTTSLLLAAATAGFSWLNLGLILLGVAIFLVGIAAVGRYLASTHPDPEPAMVEDEPLAGAPAAAATSTATGIQPETAVIIAAAIYATLGRSARVSSIVPIENPVNVDSLMLAWSLEGRREIYSSHRFR